MILLNIGGGHHKNLDAIKRGCKLFNIEFVQSDNIASVNIKNPHIIWSPSEWFEPTLFPNSKIMYGPQFFVFPSTTHPSCDSLVEYNDISKTFFNTLSPWIITLYEEFVPRMKVPFKSLPFAVDTDKFSPESTPKEYDCLIYFKHRHTNCLNTVIETVKGMGLTYTVIQYGSYTEKQYISTLNRVRFCIWVGSHESQGFALQECLSMNVPIFVWNATNMREEYSNNNQVFSNYSQNLACTTVPYWDSRCGKIWDTSKEMRPELSEFISKLNTYSPRSYVVENLSDKVCFGNLLKHFNLIE